MDFREQIDKVSLDAIEEGYIAGASVKIIYKGQVLHSNVYGYADMENQVPIKDDTIFHIYSMSKPITAIAVMILAERGVIDVRDPISKYIPAFKNQKVVKSDGQIVDVKRDVTVWDCLTMTSGMPYPDGSHRSGQIMGGVVENIIGNMYGGRYFTTLECIEQVAKVPLCFQPGEGWLYGMSADVLGAVVEVASEKRFGEFLEDEIFKPLGMVDTGFWVPNEKKHRFTQIYDPYTVDGKLKPFKGSFLGENYEETNAFESGGAGMVSTVDDYSKIAIMLLGKGQYNGVRILKEETVEFMSHNHLNDLQNQCYVDAFLQGYGYGCLMRVQEDVDLAGDFGAEGEFGWDGWTGNYFTVSPKDDLILLYFIQRCGEGFGILPRKIRKIVRNEISQKNI